MANPEANSLQRIGETAKLLLLFSVVLAPIDDFPAELNRQVGDGAFAAGQALEAALQEICQQKRLSVGGFGPLAGTDWRNP